MSDERQSLSASRCHKAKELRAQGKSLREIGRDLGISQTTVRRMLDPDVAERIRASSLEAKRRRVGTCERCGAETRYGGHGTGTSRLCVTCGHAVAAEKKIGTGSTQQKVMAFMGDGEHRFMEIVRGAGITVQIGSQLMNRMLRYGLVERPRRGVYKVVRPS